MTARLCKETRSLLPTLLFGAPILAACAWLPDGPQLVAATLVYCALCAAVGIEVMGCEITNGMQPHLFAQPVARTDLWRDKLLAQAGALLLLGAVYAAVIHGLGAMPYTWHSANTILTLGAVAPLAAIGCGSAMVLALRHVVAAQLGLMLLFLTLYFLIEGFWPIHWSNWQTPVQIAAFAMLALVGIWSGRRQFLSFENFSRLQTTLSAGADHTVRDAKEIVTGEIQRTLLWKEYRLQLLVVLVLAGAVVVSLPLGEYRDISGWAVVKDLVCLMLPLLVGAAAICEERRLGVYHWQVTLPPSRGRQWWTKVRASFSLAMTGLLIFWLCDWLAPFRSEQGFLMWLSMPQYLAYVLGTTMIGLLVSSISRNYEHAALMAVLLMIGLGVLALFGVKWLIGHFESVDCRPLFLWLAAPTLGGFALWQAKHNFGLNEQPAALAARSGRNLFLLSGQRAPDNGLFLPSRMGAI